MPDTWGPFETEREAHTAAVRHIAPEPGWTTLSEAQNHQMLTDACEAASVTLGAYDARILDWMGWREDHVCAVFAGIIRRAAASSGEDDNA